MSNSNGKLNKQLAAIEKGTEAQVGFSNQELLVQAEKILSQKEKVFNSTSADPIRLKEIETLIRQLANFAANISTWAQAFGWLIRDEELWRYAKNQNNESYRKFADYWSDFYSELIKDVSRRQVERIMPMLDKMTEAGLPILDAASIASRMPWVAEKLMSAVELDKAGELHIPDSALVTRMAQQVGIPLPKPGQAPLEHKEVVHDFLQMVNELQPQDATNLVHLTMQTWKRRQEWDGKNEVLTMHFVQMGKGHHPAKIISLKFALVGGGKQLIHPEVLKWLDEITPRKSFKD